MHFLLDSRERYKSATTGVTLTTTTDTPPPQPLALAATPQPLVAAAPLSSYWPCLQCYNRWWRQRRPPVTADKTTTPQPLALARRTTTSLGLIALHGQAFLLMGEGITYCRRFTSKNPRAYANPRACANPAKPALFWSPKRLYFGSQIPSILVVNFPLKW